MASEIVTGVVITPAIGGKGFQHAGQLVIEYSSLQTVNLTSIVADEGNGSYGHLPVTLPATGGTPTKYLLKPSVNKWKLMQWQFASTDPDLQVYLQGFIAYTKAFGVQTEYERTMPFASDGGEG